jgi:hypothetical protein
VTAIHFDRPAVVPAEEGWVMDIIPIHIAQGPVTVSSHELGLGHYAHLKGEARLTGDLYAVVLLSKLSA